MLTGGHAFCLCADHKLQFYKLPYYKLQPYDPPDCDLSEASRCGTWRRLFGCLFELRRIVSRRLHAVLKG